MQQRARNFDLPHLPAREVAYFVMRALRQRDALQQLIGAGTGLPLSDAVQGGEIATPQGSSPTWIVLMTLRLATSMTETSFETPLVVKRYFSSGVKAMCQTRCPTRRYFSTAWVAAFITATRLAGPSATNAVRP